ncbi:MAG: IS66 family insertion sequence element accessory protein TnpB [Treponema sp.]|jgi:transposase|nr:IS66 family insertion sequence element accessory protein TnpB [Treponema sp.]
MTVDLSATRIFIRPGHTDMRKAANGLTALVQDAMRLDPFSGSVYLFCGQNRKVLKAVWWDKTGFWLSQKRLEKEKFPWPESTEEVEELSREQLEMLLTGIDFWKAHKPVRYERIG